MSSLPDSRQDDYRMESEALEPDPDVMDLSSTLTESDDLATRTLSVEDKKYLLETAVLTQVSCFAELGIWSTTCSFGQHER